MDNGYLFTGLMHPPFKKPELPPALSGVYGMMQQTVLLVDRVGGVKYVERTPFDGDARPVPLGKGDRVFEFVIGEAAGDESVMDESAIFATATNETAGPGGPLGGMGADLLLCSFGLGSLTG